jgi:SAM-dependent methyltransferase
MLTVDFERLDIRPGYRILDIGCGSGRHTAGAASYPGITAIGVDRCLQHVREARSRLIDHETLGLCRGRWRTLVADIDALPFRDAYFDLVICAEVLEHMPNDKAAVAEIARVLKPGRNLVVSVPRCYPEALCWALSMDYHAVEGGHVRIYRSGALRKLLASAGLALWGRHWAHSLHTPYWWLKCLVGPHRRDVAAVNCYHRLLVWDLMQKPRLSRLIERLLNPVLGKSLVFYLRKTAPLDSGSPTAKPDLRSAPQRAVAAADITQAAFHRIYRS